MNNEKKENIKINNTAKVIIKGAVISFISLLILLLIFAAILTYTNVSEKIIPVATIVINAVSILIGSSIATIHLKKNGILNGVVIGAIYMFLIYIISGVLNNDFSLQLQSIMLIAFGIISGGIGGIIGVNIKWWNIK